MKPLLLLPLLYLLTACETPSDHATHLEFAQQPRVSAHPSARPHRLTPAHPSLFVVSDR